MKVRKPGKKTLLVTAAGVIGVVTIVVARKTPAAQATKSRAQAAGRTVASSARRVGESPRVQVLRARAQAGITRLPVRSKVALDR